jgi:hypothetical protein
VIAVCTKCGCIWECGEEEANEPRVVCGPCYWRMRPGDRVVCVSEHQSGDMPRKGRMYTVKSIERLGALMLVFIYGYELGFTWQNFRFVGRPLGN